MVKPEDLVICESYFVITRGIMDDAKWSYTGKTMKYSGMAFTDMNYKDEGCTNLIPANPLYFFVNGNGNHFSVPYSTNDLNLVFEKYIDAVAYSITLIDKFIKELNNVKVDTLDHLNELGRKQ